MTASPLTVHNAQITTVTVEIKTLTISGKQVTLAVFRQLPEIFPFDECDQWLGNPWGTVNYHYDKVLVDYYGRSKYKPCGNAPSHRHVIWQDEDRLYRSLVWGPRPHYDDEKLRRHRPNHLRWQEIMHLPQLFIAV